MEVRNHMAKFTAAQIIEASEKKYASLDIELEDGTELRLPNLLALPAERREEITRRIREAAKEDDKDKGEGEGEKSQTQEQFIDELLPLIAMTPDQGKKLMAFCGDNFALKMTIFNQWMDGTEAGEASSSQG